MKCGVCKREMSTHIFWNNLLGECLCMLCYTWAHKILFDIRESTWP